MQIDIAAEFHGSLVRSVNLSRKKTENPALNVFNGSILHAIFNALTRQLQVPMHRTAEVAEQANRAQWTRSSVGWYVAPNKQSGHLFGFIFFPGNKSRLANSALPTDPCVDYFLPNMHAINGLTIHTCLWCRVQSKAIKLLLKLVMHASLIFDPRLCLYCQTVKIDFLDKFI